MSLIKFREKENDKKRNKAEIYKNLKNAQSIWKSSNTNTNMAKCQLLQQNAIKYYKNQNSFCRCHPYVRFVFFSCLRLAPAAITANESNSSMNASRDVVHTCMQIWMVKCTTVCIYVCKWLAKFAAGLLFAFSMCMCVY